MDRAFASTVPHLRSTTASEVILAGAGHPGPRRLTVKRDNMTTPKKPSNLKMGLIIGAIPVFFFAMVFIKRIWL